MKPLKVLVACEYSGTVRDAFEDAGCDAWSCDILPTESEQTKAAGKHIQGDIIRFIKEYDTYFMLDEKYFKYDYSPSFDFDLLIGHPPCTYLSFAYTGKERYSPERLQEKINAYQFFLNLWNAPVEHICLENPMGYVHTGLLPYTQIVEPYYFGRNYKKKTCLWLKNLPKLTYSLTDNLFEKKTANEAKYLLLNGSRKDKAKLPQLLKPFDDKKLKSKFHTGIARAMSEQWTEYINQLRIKEYETKRTA
jgi:site-specific DNA-cytosine methylase